MAGTTISVVSSRKELMEFIKLPWNIYKNNPYWVPHLLMDRKKILDKNKNPFFKHAEAEYFLARRDKKVVGRIAAIKNDLHNKEHNDKVGFFGFFECENNQETAAKLFDSAGNWLKGKGLSPMRGPANPSSNDEYGLLVDGFEDTPRLLMPYNPEYYISLIEKYGFKKAKDLYAYKLENKKVVSSEKLERVQEIAKKRSGIKVRELDMKNFNKELENFKDVYNKTWEPNWGFVPMTDEEIDGMAKDLKPLVEPSLVLFGEIDNKIIGFALVMLDFNQIFKDMNGRLFPFGFLKLMTQKKKIKWARIIVLGVLPEYQRKGLDAVFYWEIVNRAHDIGIDLGEASWVLEDNEMMNRGAKVMNGVLYKTYRIYDKEI
ncbi:MAG: GNAT family N-acetyltransferase [Ignavibacteriales bacterium]|nr:MAG: GNAT family N-acetyltransferase [Ignavibacteriales bacterium]